MTKEATTQSVLNDMARSVTARKSSASLTPTPMEAWPLRDGPVITGALFPDDQPTNEIEGALLRVEREIANIRKMMGIVSNELTAQQAKEKEADARVAAAEQVQPKRDFAAEFADKQERAKAAAFDGVRGASTRATSTTGDGNVSGREGDATGVVWACPAHGAGSTVTKQSPRGRSFRACSQCGEFERA